MRSVLSFSKVTFFCALLGVLGTVEYVIILYISGAQLISGDKLTVLRTVSDKVGYANNSIGMWLALEAHSIQVDRIQPEDSEKYAQNGQRRTQRMNDSILPVQGEVTRELSGVITHRGNVKVSSTNRAKCRRTLEPLVECLERPARNLIGYEKDGNDIMLTLRTTVKFHEKRLPVLLQTWLSTVNLSNVFLVTDGRDNALERKTADAGS